MSTDREQAISFAYGNLKIDRPDITREDIEAAYDRAISSAVPVRSEPLFYIQDTRQVCGNSAFWWREDGHGYTCDLGRAWRVTKAQGEEAIGRNTDALRACGEMDLLAERHVDVQGLREKDVDGLTGTADDAISSRLVGQIESVLKGSD